MIPLFRTQNDLRLSLPARKINKTGLNLFLIFENWIDTNVRSVGNVLISVQSFQSNQISALKIVIYGIASDDQQES